CQQNNTRNTF
nr:immunoglobulin light chain junction region [Macaca mulatta]